MSGIYIPGMEMPSGCVDCPLNYDATCNLIPFGKPDETNGSERRPDCPLVPVPDHGDLIDRDALLDAWDEKHTIPSAAAKVMEKTIIPADKEAGKC